jgi:arginase
MKNRISILGMPMNGGQPKAGTHLGPEALRNAQIIERLQRLNYTVTDLGDLKFDRVLEKSKDSRLKNLDHVVTACSDLAESIEEISIKGDFPLILGGDHSMTIGTLAGVERKYNNLGVIWFDAHGDLNTAETSPTGNIHGMSLAASLGIGEERLVNVGDYYPKVRPENVVLIGARDLDEGEEILIKDLGIKVYTMKDIRLLGMDRVVSEIVEYLSHCDGVHLSLDVDAFCPTLTPGTGTCVEGGISFADGQIFLKTLYKFDIITSLEIVEVNPLLEEGNQTALITVALIAALFGDTGDTKIFKIPLKERFAKEEIREYNIEIAN